MVVGKGILNPGWCIRSDWQPVSPGLVPEAGQMQGSCLDTCVDAKVYIMLPQE